MGGALAGLRAPAAAQDGDREKVSKLFDQFDAAVAQRSTDGLYSFGIALNVAGGFPDIGSMSQYERSRVLMDLTAAGFELAQRPWLWLAAVAEQARADGDADFAVRIALGVWLWSVEFAPKMNAGAIFEGVVSAAKKRSLAAVYSPVYRALADDPTDEKLQGAAKHLAAIVVNELGDDVDAEVRAAAWPFTQ